jgi:hypothetical protein
MGTYILAEQCFENPCRHVIILIFSIIPRGNIEFHDR